jgi:hypothetical protein
VCKRDHSCDAIVVGGWSGPDGAAPDAARFSLRGDEIAYVAGMDTAGRHAELADAIADWLSGRIAEEVAFDRYHRGRDEHVLADWTACTSLAHDLSQLADA